MSARPPTKVRRLPRPPLPRTPPGTSRHAGTALRLSYIPAEPHLLCRPSHMGFPCPLRESCSHIATNVSGLRCHWKAKHERRHGPLQAQALRRESKSAPDAEPQTQTQTSGPSQPDVPAVLQAAMGHIDEMTFRYAETEAQVGRAKEMAATCLRAAKEDIARAAGPHAHEGMTDVSALIDPIIGVFDGINSKRGERRARDKAARCTPHYRHG